ncbi:MAG: hypothetical protein Sapg2KO_03830 [Saprospiraceae bacterium]
MYGKGNDASGIIPIASTCMYNKAYRKLKNDSANRNKPKALKALGFSFGSIDKYKQSVKP